MRRPAVSCGGCGAFVALLAAGCSHPRATADAPAKVAQPAAAVDQHEQAQAKFAELSHDLERLGADERVERAHLQAQLDEVLRLDGHHPAARFDQAALWAAAGDGARAEEAWRALNKDEPDFVPAAENVAALAVREGKLAAATAVYRAIVAKNPKNLTSRLALARLEVTAHHHREAIELCRDVLRRQADAIEAFRILALSYEALDNVPMAQLIVGRGLKVAKDDAELHTLLAKMLLDADDLEGGLAKLKEVVRHDPKRLEARAQLADIAVQYRDFGNAAQQYEAILKERPQLTPVQINLAVAYKGLGRYEQAEALLREVLAREPDESAALWNLAALYQRHLKRYDDATATLQKFRGVVDRHDPRAQQVEALLADIHKEKDDREAQAAQAEHDRKRKAALEAACAAVAAAKPADAAAIGNEQERIESGWQLMVQGQQAIQAGDVPGGEAAVRCAFAIIPDSPAANSSACAPMRVMWTQILYQLGRLPEATAAIQEALKCDANNPDAQLIAQQLKDMAAQGAPAPQEQAPAPAPPAKKPRRTAEP